MEQFRERRRRCRFIEGSRSIQCIDIGSSGRLIPSGADGNCDDNSMASILMEQGHIGKN